MLGCSVPLPLRLEATRQVAGLPSKLSRVVLDIRELVGVAVAADVGVAVSTCVGVAVAVLAFETTISSIEAIKVPLLKFWKISREELELALKVNVISTH